MPYMYFFNGRFYECVYAILFEITDMILKSCRMILSTNQLKMYFMEKIVMSNFVLTTSEANTSTKPISSVRLNYVFRQEVLIYLDRGSDMGMD